MLLFALEGTVDLVSKLFILLELCRKGLSKSQAEVSNKSLIVMETMYSSSCWVEVESPLNDSNPNHIPILLIS